MTAEKEPPTYKHQSGSAERGALDLTHDVSRTLQIEHKSPKEAPRSQLNLIVPKVEAAASQHTSQKSSKQEARPGK